MENLRSDVHKPPEQLEREADSARSAIEGTLAELEQRLSPGEMLDRVTDMVKRNGGEFGENLLAQVRNNPLPTIIAGIGVAWLMAASKRPPPRSANGQRTARNDYRGDGEAEVDATERWSSAGSSVSDTARSTTDSMKNAMNDAVGATTETARRAADATTDTVRRAADATTETARRAADATSYAARQAADATRYAADRLVETSRDSMRSVTEGYSYLCREQPLLLGAIAVVVGAALGAALPSTDTEDSLIGATSDEAKSRVKSEARARAGDLKDAALDAVDTAKESVLDTVSNPQSRSAYASPQETGSGPRSGSANLRGTTGGPRPASSADLRETTGGPRSDDDV